MKSTIVSMLIVLVVLSLVPMLFMNNGKLSNIFGGGKSEPTVAKPPANMTTVVTDKKVEVYRWRDEHGVLQYSNTPPADGGDSEKVVLTPDTNIIKPVDLPQEEPVAQGPKVYSLKNPYTPDGMKELVDDSRQIQEMMNQRQAEQENMMEEVFGKQK